MNLHKNNHLVTVVGLPQPKSGEETCCPILCVPSIIAPYAILYHLHGDIIKLKHFPRYWPFLRGNHRAPVNSLSKGQWGGALMFSLICAWTNGWVNSRDGGDLRRHRACHDVIIVAQNGVSELKSCLLLAKKVLSWTAFRQLVFH